VAGTTAPSSTGTVSSFNGRTGAVTPGSSDYTAAQVGAVSYLSTQAGKNGLINGGMDIWQRGTSFASGSGQYTADRWGFIVSGAGTGSTLSQVTLGSSFPQLKYGARVQRNSGTTSTSALNFSQSVETINALPFAGQTVTMSGWIRLGSNFSGSSNQIGVQLGYGTGTDQNWISVTPTGFTNIFNNSFTATTGWTQFSYTGTVSSTATQLFPIFYYTPSGTAGAADYFDITGVQLEIGSTATAFSRAGGTIQGELAACQRYYWRINGTDVTGSTIANICNGYIESSTVISGIYYFPVSMRIAPSIAGGASTLFIGLGGGSFHFPSTFSTQAISKAYARIALTQSGYTAYQAGALMMGGTSTDYLEHSAEL